MNAFRTVCALALAVLCGCDAGPQTQVWKTGVTPAQRQADVTACDVVAANQVPAAMAVAQTPTYTTPAYTSCYGSGFGYGYGYSSQANCTTTGGQVYGGQTYSYDANAGLRERVSAQCLAQKGYAGITFASCTADDLKGAMALPLGAPMPRPEAVLCIASGGQIVLRQ